jgi:uncharacterized protein YcaQ
MSAPTVSRRAVAALFLERQWLDKPRGRKLTGATLADFATRTCGVQIDSVNVVDRAHQLTLWSRFGGYDRTKLDRLIYEDRVLFEYLTHVACFVDARDLPLHKAIMIDTPNRFERRHRGWLKKQRAMIEEVDRTIAERGPLGNADFAAPKKPGERGGWWSWRPSTHALDYLLKAGRIAVHSRVHFHKRYASAPAVLPMLEGTAALTLEGAHRERMTRSLAALGAASMLDLRAYWTWPMWPMPEQRQMLKRLLDEGVVTELKVEGEKSPWYALASDLKALAAAGRKRAGSTGTTLLSPFDSFLWHRERVHGLWHYFYRIEIYVPGPKRQHGYYSLPVLHDGQLVGRVDLKTHRERGVLEARHAHFEPWFAAGKAPPGVSWGAIDRDEALAGLGEALCSLACHVGVERVALARTTPAKLKSALARACSPAGA